MELLLIRHARPERALNADGTRADPPLTPEGHAQAARLAAWIAKQEIDALYSSPLRRALQTAAAIEPSVGAPLVAVDAIAEFDRDAAQYVPLEELTREEWREAAANATQAPTPELRAFRDAAVAALHQIAAGHPGSRVAVVCHGGVINAFATAILGVDPLFVFLPDYTSISRFRVSRTGVRSIASLNEAPHLA